MRSQEFNRTFDMTFFSFFSLGYFAQEHLINGQKFASLKTFVANEVDLINPHDVIGGWKANRSV